jgi:hypothetical protein
MKRFILLSLLLLLCQLAYAQKFFIRAGVSYALPLSNSRPLYVSGFPYTGGNVSPEDNAMFEIKKASMFAGIRATAGAGFMFNRLGFDLSVATVLSEVSYSFSNSLGGVYPAGSTTTITQSAKNPLMLMPALFMRVPGKRLEIFLKAGPALPLNKKMYIESETVAGTDRYYDRSVLKTDFSVGLAFAGGAEFKIIKGLRAYAGIDILTMTVKAKEQNLLEAVNNDADVLSSKFAFEKQTIYVDDLSQYSFSSDKPRQAAAYSVPFGTKGITVGFIYEL